MKLKKQTIMLVYILTLLIACSTRDGRQETDEQKNATSNDDTTVAESLMESFINNPNNWCKSTNNRMKIANFADVF